MQVQPDIDRPSGGKSLLTVKPRPIGIPRLYIGLVLLGASESTKERRPPRTRGAGRGDIRDAITSGTKIITGHRRGNQPGPATGIDRSRTPTHGKTCRPRMPGPSHPGNCRVHRLPFQRRRVDPPPGRHSPDHFGPVPPQRSPARRRRPFYCPLISTRNHYIRHSGRPTPRPTPRPAPPPASRHNTGALIPRNNASAPRNIIAGYTSPIPISSRTRRLPGPDSRNSSRNAVGRSRMPIHRNSSCQQKHPRKKPPENSYRSPSLPRRNTLLDTRPDGFRWNKLQVMHSSLHLLFKLWVVHSSFHFFLLSRIC
jgi:hypothetical protein